MWVITLVFLPLFLFAIVGLGATWWTNGKTFKGSTHTDVSKLTAFGQIKWYNIMSSAWIHSTGAWVLFALPETGWTAGIWGVLAYAIGCSIPGVLFGIFGPIMGRRTYGYSFVDWIRSRYGATIYYILLVLSVFFLFIICCSELTGLIDAFDFLLSSVADTPQDGEGFSIAWIPALVVLVANSYACLGGLNVSLITDQIEGCFCLVFLAMCIYVSSSLNSQFPNTISWEFTPEAKSASVTLTLGVVINELINQTQWQRVFSAKSPKHLRIGAIASSSLIFSHVLTFGLCGVFVHELYNAGLMPEEFSPDMGGVDSFFWGLYLIKGSDIAIQITLAITCCVVCSTTDTLVNAFNSLMMRPLAAFNINTRWIPVISLAFTIPAIGVACARLSVIALFMTVNIVAVSIIPGIFLGALKGGSSKWALLTTAILGWLTVPIYGWCLEGTFIGGLQQFLFPRGPYDPSTAYLFLLCTGISLLGTPIGAFVHRKVHRASYDAEWESYCGDVDARQRVELSGLLKHGYDTYQRPETALAASMHRSGSSALIAIAVDGKSLYSIHLSSSSIEEKAVNAYGSGEGYLRV